MSYELLVDIVVVNCAVTLWLWAMLEYKASVKADTPPRAMLNKRIAKGFWDSKPISPPSEPPDATETIKHLTSKLDRNLEEFFQDFQHFVHVANDHFVEMGKYGDSPFRLKDLPATEDRRGPISLRVRLDGSAYFYIDARDRLNSVGEAQGRKPDPRFNDRGPFRRR